MVDSLHLGRRSGSSRAARLAEKYALTLGEARIVLATSRKNRKTARALARSLRERFSAAGIGG